MTISLSVPLNFDFFSVLRLRLLLLLYDNVVDPPHLSVLVRRDEAVRLRKAMTVMSGKRTSFTPYRDKR